MVFVRTLSSDPRWGNQMRKPIAEDAAMYGLSEPSG